jgi:cytochrome c553
VPIRPIQLRRILLAAVLAAVAPHATAQVAPPTPLVLDGNVEHGRELAYTCSGCHGVPTAVNVYPTYHVPKLGGQTADYLEIALQNYRAGLRSHPTMHAQAAQLSDQDIVDLAAYFASREGEPTAGISSADDEAIAAGQANSMTCQACHGERGMSQSPQWPNLAGQHASYLIESLRQYKNGDRENAVMAPLVSALDDEMLAQIAAFYAAQEGLFQLEE